MEFLRFGSSIPGSYWGCCACDIIQNFKVEPDDKATIQLVEGDGGSVQMKDGEALFAGPTWKDIFHQRLRFGTFSTRDMPNHAFIAILTEWQINNSIGKKWLTILKEAGFEFLRTVNNSVYSGQNLGKPTAKNQNNDNHMFVLIRNIGASGLRDPFTPPKAWTDLNPVTPEAWEFITPADRLRLVKDQHKSQTEVWNKIGPAKPLKESEAVAAGAPLTLAGVRPQYAVGHLQESPSNRALYLERHGLTPKAKQASLTGIPAQLPTAMSPACPVPAV